MTRGSPARAIESTAKEATSKDEPAVKGEAAAAAQELSGAMPPHSPGSPKNAAAAAEWAGLWAALEAAGWSRQPTNYSSQTTASYFYFPPGVTRVRTLL